MYNVHNNNNLDASFFRNIIFQKKKNHKIDINYGTISIRALFIMMKSRNIKCPKIVVMVM
jgi:hypothetical protein